MPRLQWLVLRPMWRCVKGWMGTAGHWDDGVMAVEKSGGVGEGLIVVIVGRQRSVR